MSSKKENSGEALAREMAQKQQEKPPENGDEISSEFLDFAEHYRDLFKEAAPSGFGKSSVTTQENALPPRFEDVSLCVDCRYCHAVTMPVNIRIAVGDTGQRAAVGKIRRCLLGLKLDDSPETLTALRQGARTAPLALECSHFTPWTDDELAVKEARRTLHVERMKRRREEQAALDEVDAVVAQETTPIVKDSDLKETP